MVNRHQDDHTEQDQENCIDKIKNDFPFCFAFSDNHLMNSLLPQASFAKMLCNLIDGPNQDDVNDRFKHTDRCGVAEL